MRVQSTSNWRTGILGLGLLGIAAYISVIFLLGDEVLLANWEFNGDEYGANRGTVSVVHELSSYSPTILQPEYLSIIKNNSEIGILSARPDLG